MTTFDGIIVGVIGLTVLLGFWKGIIKQIVGIAGVAAAYMMAMGFYEDLAENFLGGFSSTFGQIIAFLAIFIACIIAASLVAWIVGSMMNITGLGMLNRTGGAFLGAVKGLFIVGVAVMILIAFLSPDNRVLKRSRTIEHIQPITEMISSFAPEGIKQKYDQKAARMGRESRDKR